MILKTGPKPLTKALKLIDADEAVAVDVAPCGHTNGRVH